MKLYRVEVEAVVYCLADSQDEAEAVARREYLNEEPELSAYEATWVESEWHDSLPHHRKRDVPDKTCAEWVRELNGSRDGDYSG